MKVATLVVEDITELESLLIQNGRIVPVPAAQLTQFGQNALSLFCVRHGVYQLPTTELIDFLRKEIGGRPAIEIGSGNGCIGRALNITRTDNKMQNWPHIAEHYHKLGQATVSYGKDVKEIAAIPAIRTYSPKVVVACWVTHLWKNGMIEGNADGVDEILMFGLGIDAYIHVGNLDTHKNKPILKNNHFVIETIFDKDWLLSRSLTQKNNCIHIIKRK